MGKALMMYSFGTGLPLTSGYEMPLFGGGAWTTESSSQTSCTEDATFSNLTTRVTGGNSGTLTLRFRDAGANGQQVLSLAGTGDVSDATNTDSLTAGDLFNLSYADTGTDSTVPWVKANIALSSGHGNIHGCGGPFGNVFDVESSTRYIALFGEMKNDGTATRANAEARVRGYDSLEAIQVRCTANARTNDSTIVDVINGSDGSGSIVFGAGVTGLIEDTGLGDSITAGHNVCLSITLGTGVEDLTLTLAAGTFKSSAGHSEIWLGNVNGVARASSSTEHYLALGGHLESFTGFTEAQIRADPGFDGTAAYLRCYLSAGTNGGTVTLKLYQAGSAVLTTDITASGGAGWYENTINTSDFTAGEELSYAYDEGTSGSITVHAVQITLQAAAAGGDVPRLKTMLLMGV